MKNHGTWDENKEALEALVDRHGFGAIMGMLAEICAAKAEHLRANWQDNVSAKTWDWRAGKVTRTMRGEQ